MAIVYGGYPIKKENAVVSVLIPLSGFYPHPTQKHVPIFCTECHVLDFAPSVSLLSVKDKQCFVIGACPFSQPMLFHGSFLCQVRCSGPKLSPVHRY